ncbi:hypothetical protein BN1723_009093 [Verticillium longisporum]|uniref:DNA topoisomerase (ATP-hydrolyzing) n=1 Tax=Verticillium longisporum TaxID=100787 RepID=A0A0G4KLK9_VERLO|nr:hypothetical protein BN1723_009093 [Verticillium longisporum]
MDNIKVPQLNTITLRSRPLTTHAITISCDAELAVAADDSVHIMLPEFPTPEDDTRRGNRDGIPVEMHKQHGIYVPEMIFGHLLTGSNYDDDEKKTTGGRNGYGAKLCNVFSTEFTVECQDSANGKRYKQTWTDNMSKMGKAKITSSKSSDFVRITFKPDFKRFSMEGIDDDLEALLYRRVYDMAGTIKGIKVHLNGTVVKPSAFKGYSEMYAKAIAKERASEEGGEPKVTIMDPDFVPSGSAFSIKWSPWAVIGDKRVAVIARISRSYLGFRKVTIPADWIRGERTVVTVDETDLLGICTNLMTDAFVEWENGVWTDGDDKICRGVVASPFDAKPFQVILNSPAAPAQQQHSPTTCNTLYPEESPNEGNPATGIIIHPPNTMDRTPAPVFSLVRLVASATNDNWYQTTAPAPSDSALEDQVTVPQWASTIDDIISLSVPVAMATQNADSDSEVGGPESDSDDDFEMPTDAGEQVNPWRIRIWGLAASPGGGMHAAMVSQQSALGPEPKVKSKIFWGFKPRLAAVVEPASEGQDEPSGAAQMTTEGKMWEWMYGGGPPVRGAVGWEAEYRPKGDEALREQLRSVLEAQVCGFCKAGLRDAGRYTVCDNGHTFATCTASGLAILAPGISRACGVCGRRCLAARQIASIAETHGVEAVVDPSAVELCGGCGGKFIA